MKSRAAHFYKVPVLERLEMFFSIFVSENCQFWLRRRAEGAFCIIVLLMLHLQLFLG